MMRSKKVTQLPYSSIYVFLLLIDFHMPELKSRKNPERNCPIESWSMSHGVLAQSDLKTFVSQSRADADLTPGTDFDFRLKYASF